MVLSNFFKTWLVIELKKLRIHDSMVRLKVESQSINDISTIAYIRHFLEFLN